VDEGTVGERRTARYSRGRRRQRAIVAVAGSLGGVGVLALAAALAGAAPSGASTAHPRSSAASASTAGYIVVGSDGGVFTFGSATFEGSMGGQPLNAPVVGIAATPDGGGYWEVASDGGLFAFGDAKFYGSMGGQHLNAPVVGIAATPDGGGYWEVASDGGLFAFGDAKFYGSMGGQPLNAPVVGIAATPDGGGYWEVASDGGLFAFGDAKFYGSMGGQPLNQPIAGIATPPGGGGYWEVAKDGGVFAFGAAPSAGSLPAQGVSVSDVVGFAASVAPAPTLTAVSPTSGPATGGNTVTLTGTGFLAPTTVTFGSTPATAVNVVGPTTITATAPAGTGQVSVSVSTPAGSATRPAAYTYVPAPTVTGVSPASGPVGGGTSVTITGTHLGTTSSVNFGGTAAAGFTVDSTTSVTVTTPAHVANPVDVVVDTAYGSATDANAFAYVGAPVVTGIPQDTGSTTGGTLVTITGTDLTGTTSVDFGVTAATITANTATSVTVTTPAHAAGPVPVTVTTSYGATTDTNGFTYGTPPTVTSLSTTTGSTAGGTSVTITGAHLGATTSVNFGGTAATGLNVTSTTSATVTTPAHVANPVDVVVNTLFGSATDTDAFTYTAAPTVSGVSPNVGLPAGGTSVTITGTGFTGAVDVDFGGSPATSFTVNSDVSITAVSPPGSVGTVDITVTTPDGTSVTSAADQFTYETPPAITSLSPNAGLPAGGTSVTITGTGFTGAVDVDFGGSPATSFTVDSDVSITAVSPSGLAGTVNVTIVTPLGASATSPADQFTYDTVPTVSSVFPNAGPIAGGTSVTITGTGFTATSAVDFGATPATSFSVTSITTITAVSPAGSAGTVNVTVTNPIATSATGTGDQFHYDAVPTVTSVSPNAGRTGGANTVTITGTGFTGATAVDFGATPAPAFRVNSDTSITAGSPAGSVGTVDITVTTPGGTSATSAADQFSYVLPATVTSVSPNAGPTAGGTSVTVTGTGFTTATAVHFGGTAATTFTVNSPTTISVVSPAGSAGTVDITVTNAGGTSTTSPADRFTYDAVPTVTSVSPNAGPIAGGATVTITGTGLTGTTAVNFGGTAATSFIVHSNTSITAVSPAGSVGTVVDITVTTPGGTSVTSSVDQFTYLAAPTVTSLSVTSGAAAGGTTVTITGTGFTGTTAVHFGGTAAGAFIVNSSTTISAVSPAVSAGTVDVTVTTLGGTSATSPADQFTYIAAPVVTSVSPSAGPTLGGTTVTITGTGFTGATFVDFGHSAATFTVNSPTTITAVSRGGSAGTVDIIVTTPGGESDTSAADQFTYVTAPTVTSVSPNVGPMTGNTTVTITGTGFTGATAVHFGANAAFFTVNGTTSITATSSIGMAGTVNVTVTNPGGTSATSSADQFTYDAAPTVTSTTPTNGATTVAPSTTVTFTFSKAVNVSASAFTLQCPTGTPVAFSLAPAPPGGVTTYTLTPISTLPAGTTCTATAVASQISDPAGTHPAANDAVSFTTDTPPTVTSTTPANGATSVAVSTAVTFTFSKAVNVSASAFTLQCPSGTPVAFTLSPAPPGGITTYTLTPTSALPSGTVCTATAVADQISDTTAGTHLAANDAVSFTTGTAPTVTSLSKSTGSTAGGTTVTITGTHLGTTTSVVFGSTAGTVAAKTATSVTVTTPTHAVGTVNVVVTTPFGSATDSNAFTYGPPPTITTLSPAAGPTAGGNTIQITGTNFVVGQTTVGTGGSFGTIATMTTTTITVVVPAYTSGEANPVPVTVTTPYGSVTRTGAYTYVAAPTITSISPTTGISSGGYQVTIQGTNFTTDGVGVTRVTFLTGDPAPVVDVVSPTELVVTVPANPVPGGPTTATSVPVTVTTPGGTSGSVSFTYST
jgi:methionine-rich copper-binding protein CopC